MFGQNKTTVLKQECDRLQGKIELLERALRDSPMIADIESNGGLLVLTVACNNEAIRIETYKPLSMDVAALRAACGLA